MQNEINTTRKVEMNPTKQAIGPFPSQELIKLRNLS
jgi:hypothetical protein